MTATDDKAKKAAILSLMHGFPSSQGQITEHTLGAYMLAVADTSADAVKRSCGQFLAGKVDGHNNSFLPTAAELSANARAWDSAIAQVTADQELAKLGVPIDNGLLQMDFGHGNVDLRGLTVAEQDTIIRNNGKIGGTMVNGKLIGAQNAALLTLDQKRAALKGLPKPEAVPIPKLRKV